MQKRMDWRAITFDWNRVRAFLVTAEEGSLSAAARALGLAQPTLGRQVAALERELGVALFERTGRGLALTPGGLDLVEHARAMGEAATRLSLAASGQSQSLEGPVCISASEVYSAYLLPPVLRRLREEEPGIEIEVLASNSLSDLRRREADIALRNTRPTDPDLVARRLRDDAAHLYAAPAYLDRLGAPPRGPDDLADAQFIGFDRDGGLIEALNARGFALTQRNFPVLSANHLVQWAMVREGAGIGVMTAAVGDAEPAVRRVLPGMAPITFPVWLIAHRELRTSRRVRLVFDRVAAEIGGG
jgi:DNA-binding transcriptional LysR family regulator